MGDDLVAGLEERERRIEQRLLASGGQNHFGFLVLDAVIETVALAERATELGDTGDRGVLAEVAIDGIPGGSLGRIECREVGFSCPEIDDLDAFAPQSIHRRADFHRRRRGDPRRAASQPHPRTPLTFSRRRSSISSGTRPWTRPPSAKTSLISRELM